MATTPGPSPGKGKTGGQPKTELTLFRNDTNATTGLKVTYFCRKGEDVVNGTVQFFIEGNRHGSPEPIVDGYAEHAFPPDKLPVKDEVLVRAQLVGTGVAKDDRVDISSIKGKSSTSTTTGPTRLDIVRIPGPASATSAEWELEGELRSDSKPASNVELTIVGAGIPKVTTDNAGKFHASVTITKDTNVTVLCPPRLAINVPLIGPDLKAAATTAAASVTAPKTGSWWRRNNNYVFVGVTLFLLVLIVGFVVDATVWLWDGPNPVSESSDAQKSVSTYSFEREMDALEQQTLGKRQPAPSSPPSKPLLERFWASGPWIRILLFLSLTTLSATMFGFGTKYDVKAMKKIGLWAGLLAIIPLTLLFNYFLPIVFRLIAVLPLTLAAWIILIPTCFSDEFWDLYEAAKKRAKQMQGKRDVKLFSAALKKEDNGSVSTVLYVDGQEVDASAKPTAEKSAESPTMKNIFWKVVKADIMAEVLFKLVTEVFKRSIRI